MKPVTIIVFLVLWVSAASAETDSLYKFRLTVGAGWGFRVSHIHVPNTQLDVSTSSPAASVRLMWKPDHMLSVGFESGYLPITQVTSKAQLQPNDPDGNANLSAIPLLAIFAMDKYGFELSAGVGLYSLMVSGKASKGQGINNSALELGYSFGGSYSVDFSSRIGAGIDIKYFVFTDREIGMIVPELSFRWAIMAY